MKKRSTQSVVFLVAFGWSFLVLFFFHYFLLFPFYTDAYLLALHLSSGVVMLFVFFFLGKFISKVGVINSGIFSL